MKSFQAHSHLHSIGYRDSRFYVSKDEVYFEGDRYSIGGNVVLARVKYYIKKYFNIDLHELETRDKKDVTPTRFPDAITNQEFLDGLKQLKIDHSIDGNDRLVRSHGQTLHDIYTLRNGLYKRIPDLVLWPTSHDEVVEIVKLANEYNVVVIPFGGGTSVSGSVSCPQGEIERSIAVLDTTQMNRFLWLDKENLVACFEAGIVGQDLENVLGGEGFTMGHEPDSIEFSTLGGWVATRASGMKKNVYGNIEDLVVRVKMVTTKGVLERNISAPRVSCGPDFNQIILGSEGTLGVVTEVLVKIRPLPPVKRYGSLIFPDFESGVKFLREVAKKRCQPASIRLMDNDQFVAGLALKVNETFLSKIIENLKMFALEKLKGYDLDKLAAVTILFEGYEEDVKRQETLINEIASKYSGLVTGADYGEKGYVRNFYKSDYNSN